jgi:hypothetical protein
MTLRAFADDISYGDKYWPAMKVQTEAEAQEYLEACIEHCMRVANCTRAEAERIEKANIGYWTGYCDHDTADRVMRLFDCEYPYFGRDHPPLEKGFAMGLALGREGRACPVPERDP